MTTYIAVHEADHGFPTREDAQQWIDNRIVDDGVIYRVCAMDELGIRVPEPRKSVLTEAEGLVHGDRNADYGHPLDDFKRTAKIWGAILGFEITPAQVGLCMCGVKISRECNKSKRDNMVDLAGYAETVAWCKDEQYQRDTQMATFAPLPVVPGDAEDLKYRVELPDPRPLPSDKYIVGKHI